MVSNNPTFPRLLLCEGYADRLFFQKLISEHSLQRFHIHCAGGNSRFADALRAFSLEHPKKFKQVNDIVVVADNDEDPKQRFENAARQVNEFFGRPVSPSHPRVKGAGSPRVSILMIPWDNENGHLEQLCCASAKSTNKKLGANVDQFLAMAHGDCWSSSRYGKAWLRSYLAAACESDPCLPLGEVFENQRHNNLIPVGHNSFDKIIDFLRSI